MNFFAIYDHRVYFKNVNRKETFDWSIQLICFDGGSQRQIMWLLDFDSVKPKHNCSVSQRLYV